MKRTKTERVIQGAVTLADTYIYAWYMFGVGIVQVINTALTEEEPVVETTKEDEAYKKAVKLIIEVEAYGHEVPLMAQAQVNRARQLIEGSKS